MSYVIPKPIKADKSSVTFSKKDWEAILEALEDAEDREAIAAHRARLAAGHDDTIPFKIVERIIKGESPVKVYREWRGLSANALAKKAGVAQPYLHAIESGDKPGSAVALKKLAAILVVDMEELVRD